MQIIPGPPESECYRIIDRSGAEVTLARQGGNIISWKTGDGIERLFLSEKASFGQGQAIRGGIPVIFPQFSDHGPFCRHGFARKSEWLPDPERGSMALTQNATTLADWPHAFELGLRPLLTANALEIEFTVSNTGENPFSFQAALHSYLRVDDAKSASVQGLEGRSYHDQPTRKILTADDSPLLLGSEIDRAYFGSGERSVALKQLSGDTIVECEGFTDVVIWNPGSDHGIGDLSEDGWLQFFCIEAARIEHPIELEPGNFWRGVQRLEVTSV